MKLSAAQELQGHQDRVWCVAWSPNGAMLASCSGDKTVRIWVQSNTPSAATPTPMDEDTPIPAPQQQQLLQQDSQQHIHWRCSAVLEDAHTRTIRCAAWSPDGARLALASFDASTTIWRCVGGIWEQVAILEGHENEVKGVAWCPDSALVATCGRDKSVWVWEALPGDDYECVDVKQGHSQDVKCVAWHPQGEVLVSASYDDSIKLWSADGDEWVCAQTLLGSSAGGVGHGSTVWGVAFNASGSHMASCSDDLTVKVWACEGSPRNPSWRCVCTLTGYHSRPIYSIDWCWSEGCDWIVTGDGDNTLQVFQPADTEGAGATEGKAYSSWVQVASVEEAHTADINCVRWHPQVPGLLATAGDDGVVKLWRATA